MSTTDIEKTNLEAHAELCAERYINLQTKLTDMDERLTKVDSGLSTLTSLVTEMKDSRNNQLITWGVGIIAALIGTLGFLVYNMIAKG